jgi:hypothetical protein
VLLCLGFGKLISVSCRCTALPGEREGRWGGGEEETRVSGTAAPSRLVPFSSH